MEDRAHPTEHRQAGGGGGGYHRDRVPPYQQGLGRVVMM